ncbi:hypothetical protein [Gallaecimonas mangrovi]|uniref:hypothetical protein n=1 Tax=Gallaecimonas mangrovi TaxID=2291597 RepID=UPI000E203B57|nr:hypothetical protein [Gallaecimonas mangrovi]
MTLLKDLLAAKSQPNSKNIEQAIKAAQRERDHLAKQQPKWQQQLPLLAEQQQQLSTRISAEESRLKAMLAKADTATLNTAAEQLAALENQQAALVNQQQHLSQQQQLYLQLERQLIDLRRQLSLLSAAKELARMEGTLAPLLSRPKGGTKAAINAIREREASSPKAPKNTPQSNATSVLKRLKGELDE